MKQINVKKQTKQNRNSCQVWWCVLVNPALGGRGRRFVSSRPAWVHSKTLSQSNKNKQEKIQTKMLAHASRSWWQLNCETLPFVSSLSLLCETQKHSVYHKPGLFRQGMLKCLFCGSSNSRTNLSSYRSVALCGTEALLPLLYHRDLT